MKNKQIKGVARSELTDHVEESTGSTLTQDDIVARVDALTDLSGLLDVVDDVVAWVEEPSDEVRDLRQRAERCHRRAVEGRADEVRCRAEAERYLARVRSCEAFSAKHRFIGFLGTFGYQDAKYYAQEYVDLADSCASTARVSDGQAATYRQMAEGRHRSSVLRRRRVCNTLLNELVERIPDDRRVIDPDVLRELNDRLPGTWYLDVVVSGQA